MNKSWSKDFFPIRTSCCLSNTSFRADKSLLASITITGGRSYLSWNRFWISQSSWHRCNSYFWDMNDRKNVYVLIFYHLFLLNWMIFDIIRSSHWLTCKYCNGTWSSSERHRLAILACETSGSVRRQTIKSTVGALFAATCHRPSKARCSLAAKFPNLRLNSTKQNLLLSIDRSIILTCWKFR